MMREMMHEIMETVVESVQVAVRCVICGLLRLVDLDTVDKLRKSRWGVTILGQVW